MKSEPLKNKVGYVQAVYSKDIAEEQEEKHKDKGEVWTQVIILCDIKSAVEWLGENDNNLIHSFKEGLITLTGLKNGLSINRNKAFEDVNEK